MKFLTGDELATYLGLPSSIDTISAACDKAAEEATLFLENDLRSPLSEAIYSDTWLIKSGDTTLSQLALKLSAGWVKDNTLTMGTATTMANALIDRSLNDNVVLNLERGTLTLVGATLYLYVIVRYEAGFPEDPDNEGVFLKGSYPEWMKQAATIKAAQLISTDAAVENSKGSTVDGLTLKQQYASLVEPRIRYFPMARTPVA